MINIIKNRYIFFGISLLIIITGFTVLAIYGLPLGIDFTNGTLTEYQFSSGTLPSTADLKTLLCDRWCTGCSDGNHRYEFDHYPFHGDGYLNASQSIG